MPGREAAAPKGSNEATLQAASAAVVSPLTKVLDILLRKFVIGPKSWVQPLARVVMMPTPGVLFKKSCMLLAIPLPPLNTSSLQTSEPVGTG